MKDGGGSVKDAGDGGSVKGGGGGTGSLIFIDEIIRKSFVLVYKCISNIRDLPTLFTTIIGYE